MTDTDVFRLCSSCKKPLKYGQRYYRCSVSTCNRKRTELTFCSVPCWEAHLPGMRHREAWAEETRAPTAAEHAAELERIAREEQEREARKAGTTSVPLEARMSDEIPNEVLIVVSKMKKYIKTRSGMNTSDGVVEVLSGEVRRICDEAIRRAGQAGRRTVMARDFEAQIPAEAES